MKSQMALISLACVVIILAGLKAASSVAVPFLLAIFIAIIVSSIVTYIQNLGITKFFSFFIVIILFLGILAFLGDVVFNAIAGFTSQLPELQLKFKAILDGYIQKINSYGILDLNSKMFGFDPGKVINQTSAFLRKTSSVVSMSFFIFIMVAFMLFETNIIKEKVEYFSRKNSQTNIFVHNFISNLKRYLLIKTLSSAITGFLIGIGMWVLDVAYAPLWGILAFVLNYVPTIGSITAAIPTLFISLATMDATTTFWILGVYLFVNVMIGNIIEPRFMGEGLGISTIVVLLSLLLWGYVLGLGGLFLAVPLTMSVQIALKSNPKTKFLAIALSNKIDENIIS